MAESKAARAPSEATAAGTPKGPIILVIVNVVAVLAGLGLLTYTKLLYKRPVITENAERARIENLQSAPLPEEDPGFVAFEPVTVNIAATPDDAKPADGTSRQLQGKLHYAQIGFALEIRDIARKEDIEAIRPLIMDRFLAIVGKKQFQELVTVDGRYHLKDQLLDTANGILFKRLNEDPNQQDALVTHVYFTHFLVQ